MLATKSLDLSHGRGHLHSKADHRGEVTKDFELDALSLILVLVVGDHLHRVGVLNLVLLHGEVEGDVGRNAWNEATRSGLTRKICWMIPLLALSAVQ